jgi:hypothetical protein
MGQSDESEKKKLELQHPEIEKLKENALPPLDEQIPKNVLDAVSLVLEGLSQCDQEFRKKGGAGGDRFKTLLGHQDNGC